MSMGLCSRGHLTGTKVCWCGKKRERMVAGEGAVLVPKHLRPRDANGRNELDALREETRVSGGGHMKPWVGGVMR